MKKIELFNISKTEKQLKKVAQESQTNSDLLIQLIINNIILYNNLVELYNGGEEKHGYKIYQLSILINKNLSQFKQIPNKEVDTEDDILTNIINKVNNRQKV